MPAWIESLNREKGCMQVLIVDDDAANRRLPEVVLRRAGVAVTTVDSGGAALDAVAQGDFSVILLDLTMPTMSGIDVCEVLRRQYPRDRFRLIAYTAFVTDEDWVHLAALGFDGLLIKPVTPEAILVAVQAGGADSVPGLAVAAGKPFPDPAAG